MAQPYDSSFDQREQIRDAIDIVDLVERYVPLRRQGANFVGRCPWHDDSRPSLQVNAQRQTFKCWVCNIGGDVFSFIMRIENVDFKESMQILADIAGIELVKKKSGFKRFSNPRRNPRLAGPADSSSSAALAELGDLGVVHTTKSEAGPETAPIDPPDNAAELVMPLLETNMLPPEYNGTNWVILRRIVLSYQNR